MQRFFLAAGAATVLALLLARYSNTLRAQEPGDQRRAIQELIEKIKESSLQSWKRIPWVPTLTEARTRAAKEKLPIFLFTQDGNMANGRC